MNPRASSTSPKQLRSPRKSVGDVDAGSVARLLAATSDIALVVDDAAKVLDVSTNMPSLQRENVVGWVGRSLVELLTPESRAKGETLVKDARAGAASKWRELNIALQSGAPVTVDCVAVKIGDKDRIVVVGRDLSTVAAIQQRLIAAQAETEREYARLRQAETRFAVLFDSASEPMLILAPGTYRITEVNPAAVAVLGKVEKRIVGKALTDLLDPPDARAIATMLATLQGAGQAEDARVTIEGREMLASATLFRHERGEQVLMRLSPAGETTGLPGAGFDIGDLIEFLPDAFVVCDDRFKIVRANSAFLELAQMASLALVRDLPLERWLGRPGIDVGALGAILEQHGYCRNFHTVLRGARGLDEDVEVSAILVPDAHRASVNIAIRPVPRRRNVASKLGRELPQSVEQMTELVGRVPLKDMVREATDWIEKLSIEAALIVTGDNRASAADMLGFSRQSLYMKMRRFGIGESTPDDER